MKNFVFGLILCLVVALGFIGYTYIPKGNADPVTTEETQVDDIILGFKTPQEAILFKTNMISQKHYDSVFVSISDDILDDVATVLISQHGFTTQSSIVDEYLTNRHIYDELIMKRRRSNLPETIDILPTNSTPNSNESVTNRPRDSQENEDTTISEKKLIQTN